MPYFEFVWTDDIIEHLAEHGILQDDFERVACDPQRKGLGRSTGLPAVWGYTHDGRYIIAVYETIDQMTVLPVTAYEVPEPA